MKTGTVKWFNAKKKDMDLSVMRMVMTFSYISQL